MTWKTYLDLAYLVATGSLIVTLWLTAPTEKSAPHAPVPTPPVVTCLLDSAQVARFAVYFTPASE